jgi:4a-hydroxytetrahydrobiopterin dehydratase
MTTNLAEKTCTPCRGGVPPLTTHEAGELRGQAPEWALLDDARRIERTFRFRDFREALTFVERVGELAEAQGHHPDIGFGWGYADQEDQGIARERFHHGGEDRRPRAAAAGVTRDACVGSGT